MTSNIGSHHLMHDELSGEERERLVQQELRNFFRPEFLNRLDDVIFFSPISLESLKRIVRIQLDLILGRAVESGLTVQSDEAVIEWLAKHGYDPQFGARPLKRLIQRDVGNTLSRIILKGDFSSDKKYRLIAKGEMLDIVEG
jgi:ATP-dependent Clp protease ATP-binding subunit ClpB